MAATYGTRTQQDSSSAAVSDGAFSVSGDTVASFDYAGEREINLVFNGTFSVAPDANSVVELFGTVVDGQGQAAEDEDAPSDNNWRHFLGAFALDNVTSAQSLSITVSTIGFRNSGNLVKFWIRNSAGQTLSAGWTLHAQTVAD